MVGHRLGHFVAVRQRLYSVVPLAKRGGDTCFSVADLYASRDLVVVRDGDPNVQQDARRKPKVANRD